MELARGGGRVVKSLVRWQVCLIAVMGRDAVCEGEMMARDGEHTICGRRVERRRVESEIGRTRDEKHAKMERMYGPRFPSLWRSRAVRYLYDGSESIETTYVTRNSEQKRGK